jgi:hypothetical protein
MRPLEDMHMNRKDDGLKRAGGVQFINRPLRF